MDAFVKRFSTYRTIKQAPVISSALTLDSLDADTTTVTVKGTDINRSDTGNWLIVDGLCFLITTVKPQTDRTLLTLMSPLDDFDRPLEFDDGQSYASIGAFIAAQLQQHWVETEDPVYAMPYLVVSNSDTTAFAPPELDNNGLFVLPEYCRLMRKSYRVNVQFADAGDTMTCKISTSPVAARQISFEDGHSQLQSVDYSSSGTAKLTIIYDRDTGERDENNDAIVVRERTTWYLSDTGEVSQTVPSRRAAGEWDTIAVKGKNVDVKAKAIETFAKNKSNHKLEFWSDRDLNVQDDCTFQVYGESLQSYISYKRKSSTDKRYYYKSGELATTVTEKLRGAGI
ncbi:MAG TPA: hypothetical protein IAB83_10905 [Candidatus Faecousia faecavium]|nr:hypothetical protein [Candidatus Faecousia faecavium]